MKIETASLLIIIGWLGMASIRAVQIGTIVDQHDDQIKEFSKKMDQISIDVSYIRGKLSKNKGEN
jgi:hypothetical protein